MLLRHLHPVVHGQVPLSLSYFTIANAQTKRPQFGAEFELGPSWGSLGKPQGVCGFHSADHIQQRRAAHFCSLILISQSYHRRNARGAARALNRVVPWGECRLLARHAAVSANVCFSRDYVTKLRKRPRGWSRRRVRRGPNLGDHRTYVSLQRYMATRAFSSEVDTGSREENASKQEIRAPFRFNRNGKGSLVIPGRPSSRF
jgi:hypothetical protein